MTATCGNLDAHVRQEIAERGYREQLKACSPADRFRKAGMLIRGAYYFDLANIHLDLNGVQLRRLEPGVLRALTEERNRLFRQRDDVQRDDLHKHLGPFRAIGQFGEVVAYVKHAKKFWEHVKASEAFHGSAKPDDIEFVDADWYETWYPPPRLERYPDIFTEAQQVLHLLYTAVSNTVKDIDSKIPNAPSLRTRFVAMLNSA